MHGVVFAVHREQFAAGLLCGGHHQFSGCNQDLFVGKCDGLTQFDGFVSRFEPHDAHGCRNENVSFAMRAYPEHAFPPMMNCGKRRNAFRAQVPGEFIDFLRIAHRNHFWVVTLDLADQFIKICARCQRHYAKAFWQPLDNGERLPAYGARRTQYGKVFHRFLCVSYVSLDIAAGLDSGRGDQNPIIPDNGDGQDKGIDAVKNTAVSRQKSSGILHASAALVG